MGHINGCLYLKTANPTDCHCDEEFRHYIILAILSLSSFLIQVLVGIYTRSLALMSDGVHAGSDLAENILSAFIAKKARGNINEERIRLWGGRISSVIILLVSMFIMDEALGRLRQPEIIVADVALYGATVGFIINIIQIITHGGARHEHRNVTHYMQDMHLWADLLGSITAITGTALVLWGGYVFADTFASFVIVGIIWFRIGRWVIYGMPKHEEKRDHRH